MFLVVENTLIQKKSGEIDVSENSLAKSRTACSKCAWQKRIGPIATASLKHQELSYN